MGLGIMGNNCNCAECQLERTPMKEIERIISKWLEDETQFDLAKAIEQCVIKARIEECGHMRTYYDSRKSIRQYLIERIEELKNSRKD
jgi:hypothetical protein